MALWFSHIELQISEIRRSRMILFETEKRVFGHRDNNVQKEKKVNNHYSET